MNELQVHKLGKSDDSEKPPTTVEESRDVFQTPPPAKPMPGLRGNPPLPVGEPVMSIAATPSAHRPTKEADFTEEELKTLKTIPGWSPGMAIPENLADALASLSRSAKKEALDPNQLQPPVSQDTPPLKAPEPLDISQLPRAKQEELRQFMAESAARDEAAVEKAKRHISGAGSGVNEAISGASIKTVQLEDDREEATYAGTNVPKSGFGPTPEPVAAAEPELDTGLDSVRARECPHCGWNLAEPDALKIGSADKRRFIQCALGGISFEKVYDLVGGKLQVIFRELSPLEADKCYQAVYYLRNQEKVVSPQEFIEMLTRYRLCLQLKLIRTDETSHEFPTDLSGWDFEEDASGTKLPAICDQVFKEVVKNESLLRMVSRCLGDFNRLLAKLEANAQNSDFWKETESET